MRSAIAMLLGGLAFLMGANQCGPTELQDAIDACNLNPDTCRVIEDEGDDQRVAEEIQRAWNEIVLEDGQPGMAFVMAGHGDRWILERRVRLCSDDDHPVGSSDAPDCSGPDQDVTVAFGGDFRVECDFDEGVPVSPDAATGQDACLWIGDATGAGGPIDLASGPRVQGLVDISTGMMLEFTGNALVWPATPFLCDGCVEYQDLRVLSSLEADVPIGYGGGPVFVGGSGSLTIEQAPSEGLDVRLDGPHEGTTIHGETGHLGTEGCDYAGESYDCNVDLDADLTIRGRLTWRDGGTLDSDATVRQQPGDREPTVFLGVGQGLSSSDRVGEPIGTVDLGGLIVSAVETFNPIIRLEGEVWTWTTDPTVLLRGTFVSRKSATAVGPVPNFSNLSICKPIKPFDPGLLRTRVEVFHVLESARFVIPDNRFPETGQTIVPTCGISAWASEVHTASVNAATPAAVTIPTGPDPSIDGAVNGAVGQGILPRITDADADFTDVEVGHRWQVTSGPMKGETRIVVGKPDASTLELSDRAFLPGKPPSDTVSDLIGASYRIEEPSCLDLVAGTWGPCGLFADPVLPAARVEIDRFRYLDEGEVRIGSDPGDGPAEDVSCHLTWVRNGVERMGSDFAFFVQLQKSDQENPHFNVGGDSTNTFGPLRDPGDVERRMLGDDLRAGDWLELQLTSGSDEACRAHEQTGATCRCFGGHDLGSLEVEIEVFDDEVSIDPDLEDGGASPYLE